MTSKDNALYEVRKHNDFSVLCSDDEEVMNGKTTVSVGADAVELANPVTATSGCVESESAATPAADGFETFTTARKPKRFGQTKPFTSSSTTPTPTQSSTNYRSVSGKPKELVHPKSENSIELYDFPSTLKTADLRKFLGAFEGHYRIKWINDTSCYVVFDEESLSQRALTELKDDNIKIKSYIEPASAEAQLN